MSTPRGGPAVVGVGSGAPGCGGYLFALGGGWATYTAAAAAGVSDVISARSSFSFLRMPAYVAAKLKPFGIRWSTS